MANEAGAVVRQYLEKHPASADAHFLLGYILFREIQESAGDKSGAPPGDSGDVAVGLDTATRESKAKASLAEFTEGAKYHHPSALDLKIVALDYVLLGDYPDADRWLTRSLEGNPKDSEGWYYLGRTKYNEDRFVEAIAAFGKCLQLDPKNVKAEDNLGLSYARLDRNEEAAAAYQRAIAWQADAPVKNPGPFIDLGALLQEQNRMVESIPYLIQAIEISPREFEAHEQLGKAYEQLNQLEKAQSEMEKAVELAPGKSGLHYMLGRIYRKLGLKEKAKIEFDRTAALRGKELSPSTREP